MPKNVYVYDQLLIGFLGTIWREPGPDADKLSMVVSIRNPVGTTETTRRLPSMELWDGAGRVFETTNEAWAEAILPYSEVSCQVEFEIAPDAENLELVLAPGDPEEVRAPVHATEWTTQAREGDPFALWGSLPQA